MLSVLGPEELASELDAAALEALELADIHGPPVDAFRLARALHLTVAQDDRQGGRARYVRLGSRRAPPRATVLLRSDPRPERRQWALAHEIGEHLASRAFARLGIDPRETSPNAREAFATQLGARLLLPTAWFEPDALACRWNLLALKSRYATASHELIARRMLNFAPPVVITILDHGSISLRQSNVAGRVPPLSPLERQAWQAVHEGHGPLRCDDGPHTIHVWPVHEDGWKREIIRTEVDEFAAEF